MLEARSVNVYEPAPRPTTVHVSEPPGHAHVAPPGLAVTVYPLMGLLPELAGADHVTVARPTPPTAPTEVGAPGATPEPGLT